MFSPAGVYLTYGWNHHWRRSQIRNGTVRIGSSQTSMIGIFLAMLSGSRVARYPRTAPPTRVVAVQPYQYMAGPSPLRLGPQPHSRRLTAGWYVKSGQFTSRQRQ